MPDKSHPDFRYTALAPELLALPYKVQTNWHVITGASCSGKSTLINLLAREGFNTLPEVSREYFESEMTKGRTIEEIRADRIGVTLKIFDLMKKRERGLPPDELMFLDRAVPDILVFWRLADRDPNEYLPDCFLNRYASVFILDRLPYQRDDVRRADEATATFYDECMTRDYRALGYDVVRVPVMPPADRLAFVLERLTERGQI